MEDIYYINKKQEVAIFKTDSFLQYVDEAPYNPSDKYPEYPFSDSLINRNKGNIAYEGIRETFHMLGYDKDNYGTSKWNPLASIICENNKVVIKPNFVTHSNTNGSIYSVITNPNIIRAVIDYVYIALKGTGQIIVADSPQADCNFDEILRVTELDSIVELYKREKNYKIEIIDLRQLRFEYHDGVLDMESRILLDGDPMGYSIINLRNKSAFSDMDNPEKLYGADYNREETILHHSKGNHEYCVSNTILSADVIISIPKIKTHRKAGVTLNFKNMIGINGNKNYLPHFKIGVPSKGGDEAPELEKGAQQVLNSNRLLMDKLLSKPNKVKVYIYKACYNLYHKLLRQFLIKKNQEGIDTSRLGNWYGNDTIWRTTWDLNYLTLYADVKGSICLHEQRKLFTIIDGLLSGENDGPLLPTDKKCGIIVTSDNFLSADIAVIRLMGFDYKKIPLYRNIVKSNNIKYADFCITNNSKIENLLRDEKKSLEFIPTQGWKGHIEL